MNRLAQSSQRTQRRDPNEIAKAVLDAAFRIHTELGPGLLESVYEVVLARELADAGFDVERQRPVSIQYRDMNFDEGFRADLIVDHLVLVEIKSVAALVPVHAKQLLTYLRLTALPLGLLINFGEASLRNGIKRLVNGLTDSSTPLRPSRPLREPLSL